MTRNCARQATVTVNNKVVGTIDLEGDVNIEVTLEPRFDLNERNPLHDDALNMSDLKVGMNIIRRNQRYLGFHPNRAMINGQPFRRGTKYEEAGLANSWMVPVVTTDHNGKLVLQDWFLADMGVVRYESPSGRLLNWNEQNYTLEA